MDKEINMFEEFINSLKQVENTAEFTNQYYNGTANNDITTNNLRLYLNYMLKQEPKFLFVGEAPGYKGCRITGIPFTSEYILTQNYGNGIFGTENGYETINVAKPNKEPTATIVWEIFNKKKILPCFWNAFPFHSYNEGNMQSNREPEEKELAIGLKYFLELKNILKIKKTIAIGKVSYNLLKNNNIHCEYIRHPSYGGKNEFIEGLERLNIPNN